jgi:hypothetical protein
MVQVFSSTVDSYYIGHEVSWLSEFSLLIIESSMVQSCSSMVIEMLLCHTYDQILTLLSVCLYIFRYLC